MHERHSMNNVNNPLYQNLLFCKVEMSCHVIQNKKKAETNDKYRFAVAAPGLFGGEKRVLNAEAL